jgi:hypothetical protein
VVFVGADTGEEQVRDIKVPTSFARSIAASDVPAQRVVPMPVRNDGRPLLPEHSSVKTSSWRGLALMSLRRNRLGLPTRPVISSDQSCSSAWGSPMPWDPTICCATR